MEHQRKHSQFFRWAHAFCSMVCTAASMTPLTFLASWGQMDTQRIQEIQDLSFAMPFLNHLRLTTTIHFEG